MIRLFWKAVETQSDVPICTCRDCKGKRQGFVEVRDDHVRLYHVGFLLIRIEWIFLALKINGFQGVHGNYSQYWSNYSEIYVTSAFWVNHFREPFQTFTTSGLSEPGLDKLGHHMWPSLQLGRHKQHFLMMCWFVQMLKCSLSFRWATMKMKFPCPLPVWWHRRTLVKVYCASDWAYIRWVTLPMIWDFFDCACNHNYC